MIDRSVNMKVIPMNSPINSDSAKISLGFGDVGWLVIVGFK